MMDVTGQDEQRRFSDRRQAGRALAEQLVLRMEKGELTDPVVLALPRGGLPVAEEIAQALDAPLDVLVARKIGAPHQPELGVGAIAGDDPPIYDASTLAHLGLTEAELAPIVQRERAELRRREALYRNGRPPPDLSGCSAIVVDDGLATGSTARAALRFARRRRPARLVLAIPVCAPEAVRMMRNEADDIVCLHEPRLFGAVGFWYEDFAQLTDDDVLGILHGRGGEGQRRASG